MKSILLLASILTGIISYSQQAPSFVDSLNHWFITGQYSADILAITPNEKAQQYEKTIQDSIKNNLDWFKEFSKTIKKGSDLPYHKNLGLSETEYHDFLVLRKKKHFGLKGNAKVSIMNNDIIFFLGIYYPDIITFTFDKSCVSNLPSSFRIKRS